MLNRLTWIIVFLYCFTIFSAVYFEDKIILLDFVLIFLTLFYVIILLIKTNEQIKLKDEKIESLRERIASFKLEIKRQESIILLLENEKMACEKDIVFDGEGGWKIVEK